MRLSTILLSKVNLLGTIFSFLIEAELDIFQSA